MAIASATTRSRLDGHRTSGSRCHQRAGTGTAGFLRNPAARAWIKTKTGRAPDVWVLAIVVDEDFAAERTNFRHATARWGLLADTGLSGVAVVTIGSIEKVVEQMTADGFGHAIERAWAEAGSDLLSQPPEEPTPATTPRPQHLEYALQRLIAGST